MLLKVVYLKLQHNTYTGKTGIKTVIAAKEYCDNILVKEIQQQKDDVPRARKWTVQWSPQ
jgi:hypothetical protein